jgi:hypothetical protein
MMKRRGVKNVDVGRNVTLASVIIESVIMPFYLGYRLCRDTLEFTVYLFAKPLQPQEEYLTLNHALFSLIQ